MTVTKTWVNPETALGSGGLDVATNDTLPETYFDTLASLLDYMGGSDGTSKTGVWKLPNQPAFLAYLAATVTNQTGNGAVVNPVPFTTEVYDQAANFASSTFTAPHTCRMKFDIQVTITDPTVAMTSFTLNLVTSNRTYQASPNIHVETAGDTQVLRLSPPPVDMDAADTAYVTLQISGGAGDTADIFGAATLVTFFGGIAVA